jgi:hypothetical protein
MSNIYTHKDLDKFYFNFYNVVNNIIYKIYENNKINKYLFYCNYHLLNDNSILRYPLTICLGGGGYIQYNYIFKNEKLIDRIELSSKDYDISFALNNINNDFNIDLFIKEIEKIYNESIKEFKFKNLNKEHFKFTFNNIIQRIHIRIEFNNKKSSFHILELSFWLNGKISDNFTINDFNRRHLLLYKYENVFFIYCH